MYLKTFKYSIYTILLWIIPFWLRIAMGPVPAFCQNIGTNTNSTIDKVMQACAANNSFEVFVLIFLNNIKCCLINILSGVLFGIGTLFCTFINGFMVADMFVYCHQTMSVEEMLVTTLPHSFELLGFWLSGGVGFIIAWRFKRFVFNEEQIDKVFIKKICLLTGVASLLTLGAAFVESYISVNMLNNL